MTKMIHTGIALLAAGAVGIIVAIVMEITTGEPIYYLVMKLTAILFGVGGPLFGWGIVRRSKREKK